MKSPLSMFTTSKGEAEFKSAYADVLKLWPVPYKEIDIPTLFGDTHVIISGSEELPPLVLLHATGASAAMWFPNIESLSAKYCVFAVDIIGDAGKSIQTRLLTNRDDCGDWLLQVLDGLGLQKTNLGGLSYGGWHTLNFSMVAPHRINKLVVMAPGASILPFSWPVLLLLRILPYFPVKPNPFPNFFCKGFKPSKVYVRLFAIGIQHFKYPDPRKSIFTGVFSEDELRTIKLPVLFLVGEKEVIYDPRAVIEKISRLIPQIETHIIPEASHFLSMEQPQAVTAHILKFLAA